MYLSSISHTSPICHIFPYTTLFRSSDWLAPKTVLTYSVVSMRSSAARLVTEKIGPAAKKIATETTTIAAEGNTYFGLRSEEHTSELQSRFDIVCSLLLETKNINNSV